ncbi:MAG TPA: bifunctional adenosylcobinamide kinase/adenosylcobinamide-phosphate guanylyltransferase [Desulfomonilaceae bacterium]|nr:bifunctional adenosylcobinamide kinase/adenosylcobinamide-phosphate guanylyltransferase [Desulfomonilaceae bacterium]
MVLVTGGSRSGKSEFARHFAQTVPGRRAFVATCPVVDEEMKERIEKHRRQRAQSDWQTIEEPIDLRKILLESSAFSVFLIDCLTLWVNNLLYAAQEQNRSFSEEDAVEKCAELVDAARNVDGTVVIVTNEVGWGIVPENAAARLFRDIVGRCNETVAAAADEVFLIVCGYPVILKKGNR